VIGDPAPVKHFVIPIGPNIPSGTVLRGANDMR